MRNKIVKQMRRALKPLVRTDVLHKTASYEDTIKPIRFFNGMGIDAEGKFRPKFNFVDGLVKRVLKDDCVKYHVKEMKRDYKLSPL